MRPQLRYHYAGDIPTYATSDAFEPDVRANQDLDGLMFPDMPWMLGGDLAEAVRAATRDAWPNAGTCTAAGCSPSVSTPTGWPRRCAAAPAMSTSTGSPGG